MVASAVWWGLGAVLVGAGVLWGPIASDVEQAPYSVMSKDGAIEIREYAPHIVAETKVSGEQEKAISDGFRAIADYIFGNNTASAKVAMTAPVIQQPATTSAEKTSQKIAMTAPVLQHTEDAGQWVVQFVMPKEYTKATLPKPNNPAVTLVEVKVKRMAVIQFSGMAGEDSLREHTAELEAYMASHGLKARSKASFAFYNPPWTLPFLRRNEVMMEIAE
jgi:hypothetical protein